jgi:hypothetical protein
MLAIEPSCFSFCRHTDQGGSWIAVNEGLTNLGVRALAVAGEKLFAGTFGGGVFVTDVEQ